MIDLSGHPINLSAYTQHSGGAVGSDIAWTNIGRPFGLTDARHYWHDKCTPYGNVKLSDAQIEEGWKHVLLANRTLGRQPEKFKSLLSRNWWQVKNSQAVFAIGLLTNKRTEVKGGTGWAVQMAIDDYQNIYLFDLDLLAWYAYDWRSGMFKECGTPLLKKDFAGIGTRNITPTGIDAIKAVYDNTVLPF